MKRIHIVGILILTWLLLVAHPLIFIPSIAQSKLTAIADYPAPISTYVFEKNFTDTTLSDSIEINVPFRIPEGGPQVYGSTIDFTCRVVEDSEGHDRVVSVNYTFFSNDNYFDWIRHDFVGALKGTSGGSYPTQTISKPETLNIGDNKLAIRVLINASAEEPSSCYFRLEISNVHVRVEALDLDGDGILDPIDPLLSFNNIVLLLAGVTGIFTTFIVKRRLSKEKVSKTVPTPFFLHISACVKF